MSQNAIMSNNPDEKIMDETTTKIEPIEQKVIFTGKGIEFFKIWIVNLLLSILTLGIYSAWAKVRTNQYFYGNTSIDGHAFRYLARPLQILKGRIIAVVVFAIVVALTTLSPSAAVFFWLVFFLVFPWLLIQSIKFNMRMTSFRNVRFDFNATYMNTFGIILLLPILIPLSVGLAFPWIKKTQDKFMHNNVSYGSQSVSVNTKTSTYFFALFMTTITLLIFGLFFTYLITSLTQILVPYLSDVMYRLMNAIGLSDLYWNMNIAVALMIFLAWIFFSSITSVYQAIIRNHLWNSMTFTEVATFKSSIYVPRFVWIKFTNLCMIIVTLGLAYPFARVRLASYLAECTQVVPLENAKHVIDNMQQQSSVFGEEAADVYDVDFALGG